MTPEENPNFRVAPKKNKFIGSVLQILFSLAVLGCGVALAMYYLDSGPKAKPRKRPVNPPLVQTELVSYHPHKLTINGMGSVTAAKEIQLTAKVGGEIIEVDKRFNPGGFFAQGEQMLSIDPIDYQLTIQQLQSEVARAQSELDLEMGNQLVARKEFEILGQDVSEDEKRLMLREPQQAIKKTALDAAKAKLAQAQLDLTRTRVSAPFNAVVQERSVNMGSRVNQTTTLANLVGTDEFWLKIAIPVQQLKWLEISDQTIEKGAHAKIFLQQSTPHAKFRTGRVVQLAAGLEENGRMAIIFISIEDPLCLKAENKSKAKLFLNSYVQVEIDGIELPSVFAINRHHLRDNNTVWLVDNQNKLEIRPVNIVTKNSDQVLIASGVSDGERIITSSLSAPIAGTLLRLIEKEKSEETPAQAIRSNEEVSGE